MIRMHWHFAAGCMILVGDLKDAARAHGETFWRAQGCPPECPGEPTRELRWSTGIPVGREGPPPQVPELPRGLR